MAFTTKLDFSSNRQVKQDEKTITALSGGTSFGLPYNQLTSGPDLNTSAVTNTIYVLTGNTSTFSGNNTTTNFTWFDSRMNIADSSLSAITLSNSAITQNTVVFTANTSTTIDGNVVNLTYSGVSFDMTPLTMVSLGGGNYSGTVITHTLNILSASTLDFTGRTIWVDVSGITRTEKLIITNNPQIGYVWTCVDSEGGGEWTAVSGSSLTWTGGTGSGSVVLNGSNSIASGNYSVAEGRNTIASGEYSHTEGSYTKASGADSHAEGNNTVASGQSAHAEGWYTVAGGDYSHAGGYNTLASGDYSFVHGLNSHATNMYTVVFGQNVTGTSSNTVYVPDLVIDGLTSTDPIATDLNGKIVAGTSDGRLKQNITDLNNSLDIIKNLRGVSFEYTLESNMGEGVRYGFIAQEVQKYIPDIVRSRAKGDGMLSLNYNEIVPILVEAVKEISTGSTNNVYLNTQTILAEDNNIDLNYSGTPETAIGGGIRVLHALGNNISAEFITDNEGNFTTNNDFKPNSLTIPLYTPTSSDDINGNIGNITRDDEYLYIKCQDGWKRSNLERF